MQDISKLNFVCVDNKNCPANFDNTRRVFKYGNTYAVPDKKNETCCPYCNSILFEEEVYLKILLSRKRMKQKKIVLLLSMVVLLVVIFLFIYFQNSI